MVRHYWWLHSRSMHVTRFSGVLYCLVTNKLLITCLQHWLHACLQRFMLAFMHECLPPCLQPARMLAFYLPVCYPRWYFVYHKLNACLHGCLPASLELRLNFLKVSAFHASVFCKSQSRSLGLFFAGHCTAWTAPSPTTHHSVFDVIMSGVIANILHACLQTACLQAPEPSIYVVWITFNMFETLTCYACPVITVISCLQSAQLVPFVWYFTPWKSGLSLFHLFMSCIM